MLKNPLPALGAAFVLLVVVLLWSGSGYTYQGANWLLATPPTWIIQAGAVGIMIVYAAFFAFVRYMQVRERRESQDASRRLFDPPDGPGEDVPEPASVTNVLPLARRAPGPPTQPIPQPPVQAPAAEVGEGQAS